MGGRTIALVSMAIVLLATPAWAEPTRRVERRVVQQRRVRLHSFLGFRPRFHPRRYPPLLQSPPDEFLPPEIEEGPPPEFETVPLPHGFIMTIPMGTTRPVMPAVLNRYGDVGQALASCWVPPSGQPWTAVTLRVSFRRDGSVNGVPRIPYAEGGSPEQKTDLAHSLLAALNRCAPLHFSPSLGSAIAGEIYAIRFTNQEKP